MLGIGQLGQGFTHRLDVVGVDDDRQQIRAGEVAVIVSLLLGAHRAGFIFIRIVETSGLNHPSAVFDQVDLALYLAFDRLLDKTERVDILGFGTGA